MNIIRRTLDIGEDRRRLDAFSQTRTAVPLDDVKNWAASGDGTPSLSERRRTMPFCPAGISGT